MATRGRAICTVCHRLNKPRTTNRRTFALARDWSGRARRARRSGPSNAISRGAFAAPSALRLAPLAAQWRFYQAPKPAPPLVRSAAPSEPCVAAWLALFSRASLPARPGAQRELLLAKHSIIRFSITGNALRAVGFSPSARADLFHLPPSQFFHFALPGATSGFMPSTIHRSSKSAPRTDYGVCR